MGQKVNPHGLRVGVIKDWDSRWYAREDKVGDLIVEDYNIRKYLKSTLYSAGIAKIEIERDNAKVKISIHCSRPGVIIGKGGTEIEKLRQDVEKLAGQIAGNAPIAVRAAKKAINEGLDLPMDEAVVVEEKAFGSCFQSADQQEGMGAFLEKRKHEPFINK